MEKNYDVVVVGAGSMGMAAGCYLAQQGVRALLIDAHDPPHALGSHHGDTRIIRHAYGEGRQYVPLALRAQTLWASLEEASGQTLFANTGVLSVGSEGAAFLAEVIESAQLFSLPLEVLSRDEMIRRLPGLRIPEGYMGCLETTSGVLFSERCIRAFRDVGTRAGMTVLPNTRVEDVIIHPNHVVVATDHGTFSADKLILSAGAAAPQVLRATGLNLPLQPVRKTVGWFASDETLFASSEFPAFTFDLAGEFYYGFPSFDGSGVKVGRHDGGLLVADVETMNRTFGAYPEDEGELRGFLSTFMPQASGALRAGKTCLYTLTPDEHFIVDTHPNHSHVVIAAGFSGHGFKFASVIGEILAELSVQGSTTHDISRFSIQRFQRPC
ncbi:N-methyl-L-tryptophan oxidase [Alicyclobacillus fastidiosus]|uniref:N-methyl-L-tryptophan oxidase n=1 Tax=Alicyclobacillus fastidiosus TaxID=392011 RepID=A0ABY6ZJM3_9BACL|nr:N-methyl-L-tryptophan oxidase [Alicyclobacillus fastidiosus]WAH42110.1 N-methyl-L-tryptophan oxidase [Alicyclobacillus fastidiosus]GMA63887.1 N-methyl-L-tryptophan oxidase [Alicyclobacillus fastidiosus]